MKWEDSTDAVKKISAPDPILFFLIDNKGAVKAWIHKPDGYYWAKFMDDTTRGPFVTEAAAKLAAELMYNN